MRSMVPQVLYACGLAVMVVVAAWLFPAGLATMVLSLLPMLALPRLLGPGQWEGLGERPAALPRALGQNP